MEFTENELKTIKDARKAIKSFRNFSYLICVALLLFLFGSLLGYLDVNVKTFIYPSFIFIFILYLFPGIVRRPKYIDLVELLERKTPKKDAIEFMVDALKETK